MRTSASFRVVCGKNLFSAGSFDLQPFNVPLPENNPRHASVDFSFENSEICFSFEPTNPSVALHTPFEKVAFRNNLVETMRSLRDPDSRCPAKSEHFSCN
jgi:hypothetical protein